MPGNPQSTGKQLGLFLLEPIGVLLAILAVSAILKPLSFAGDQIVTLPAGLLLLPLVPIWAFRAHRTLSAAAKAVMLLLQGAVWFGITYAALSAGVLTEGIHQPGAAFLLLFPTLGFVIGFALLGGLAIYKAVRSDSGGAGGASNPGVEADRDA